jgi:lactate dehydrogenase-like 2-hydroxyacid dehydrogenase
MKTLMMKYPNISTHSIHHNSAPTAEMAVTLILAAAKKIIQCDAPFRKNDWRYRYDPEM